MGTKAFTAKAAHALSNNGWERKSGGWYVRRYNGGIVATLRASGFWEVRGPAGDTRAHGDDIPCEAWMALDAINAFPALKDGDFRLMEGGVPPREQDV